MSMPSAVTAASPAQAAPSPAAPGASHGFTFHDLLETVNPLQHLPIISTIYRHLTGDTISNTDRIVGDTLYGGPVGLVLGMVNAHMMDKNGKDMGDRAIAMVGGDDSPKPAPAAANVADAAPAVPGDAASADAPAKPISQSVTLSALPSKPPPNLVPDYRAAIAKAQAMQQMPAAQTARMPAQAMPVQTAQAPQAQMSQAQMSQALSTQAAQAMAMRAQGMPAPGMPSGSPDSFAAGLPQMGSSQTASELATAAPITTQTAQLQGTAPSSSPPPGAGGKPVAMQGAPISVFHGFAVDTSEQGIMAMRAHTHQKAPVPLELSSGAAPVPSKPAIAQPAPISSDQFAQRMREGLEKYKAMMRQGQASGAQTAATATAAAATVTPAPTVH